MKRHLINGLFVSKDHQQKCRKACTLWKLACSSYPCFTLGITRNLVIELCPPASLCSPREPVLLLCTGPLLKPEEVKKKKCRKRGLQFKVASSNKFLNATVISRELRYATSFKKRTEGGWRARHFFNPKLWTRRRRPRTAGHLRVRLTSEFKK